MKYIKTRKRPADSDIKISVYVSLKKKNRGLKRLLKPVEVWKNNNLNLNMKELEDKKNQYVKLNFSSFFHFFKSQTPPLWYQRILLKALFDIYKSWFTELSKLNKLFYLKIWLMKNDFMLSQIVVGIDEDIDIYPSVFKESPINQNASLNRMIKNFSFLDTMFIVPLLHLSTSNTIKDNLDQKEIKKIKKNSINIINEEDGSITYVYSLDTVLLCSL